MLVWFSFFFKSNCVCHRSWHLLRNHFFCLQYRSWKHNYIIMVPKNNWLKLRVNSNLIFRFSHWNWGWSAFRPAFIHCYYLHDLQLYNISYKKIDKKTFFIYSLVINFIHIYVILIRRPWFGWKVLGFSKVIVLLSKGVRPCPIQCLHSEWDSRTKLAS